MYRLLLAKNGLETKGASVRFAPLAVIRALPGEAEKRPFVADAGM